MINKVSSIKGILAGSCCVIIFIFFIIYFLVTYNFILLPGLILFLCGSLAGTIIILLIADLEIEHEKLKIIYFFKIRKINIKVLIVFGMEKPSQGMFYLHTNIGFLMLAFNYKNYQGIKKIISACKESNVSVKQLEIFGKKLVEQNCNA
jgi:hypothetical protein